MRIWISLALQFQPLIFEREYEKLTIEVSDFKEVTENFTNGHNFEMLLGKQKSTNNKQGVGYIDFTTTAKASSSSHSLISGKFFGKNRHYKHACSLTKPKSFKQVLIPKVINQKDPRNMGT